MGLSSFRPRRISPVVQPTPALTALAQLQEQLRTTVAKATRLECDNVLKAANAYGWERLLREMPPRQRVDLVERMAGAIGEQRKVIDAVADAYDRVLTTVTQAADDEIRRLDSELERLENELWASRSVAVPRHRGPSWWTVAIAGVGGYWLGHRR